MIKDNYYAFVAGTCAAGAGFFGKLSGNAYISINIYASALCIISMVIMNAIMWTYYSKALSLSDTSIGPTVTSSATNYLLSVILGVLVFGEATSLLWWFGTSLVLLGLVMVVRGKNKQENISEKKTVKIIDNKQHLS